jgi:membrane protein insertase Oxa1/YidC/SpoIIIJ
LILYWLSFNVLSMAQQFYLIRKYHTNPAAAGPHPESALADTGSNGASAAVALTTSGLSKPITAGGGGSRAARKRRSSRR